MSSRLSIQRRRIRVRGIVQGVGFRPCVYRLAVDGGLTGFVRNDAEGVLIEIEGRGPAIETFCRQLKNEPPALAKITSWEMTDLQPDGDPAFSILDSDRGKPAATLISPDVAVCADCLRELYDPGDRRYLYPFINCTLCGPRFTIVEGIPYDRSNTSMAGFPMCPACSQEYHRPQDRRFHAQPVACPACGPQLQFFSPSDLSHPLPDPLQTAIGWLDRGKILAVKGLGGFHLAVDARDTAAVAELRRRKGRAEKPFALMAPDLDAIREFCRVSDEEAALLLHPSRPIVLLTARPGIGLSPLVAPQNRFLGFMLPYTPLHDLLLRDHFKALVMTSGNFSEEPIAIDNREAFDRLGNLADGFLIHNRDILQRCDDSIARLMNGKPAVIRRSRGHVPQPLFLERPVLERILACGGELKNAIALARGKEVFLSQHIGDLDNPSAFAFYRHAIAHLQRILEIEPQRIACDQHPDYLSTRWAEEQGVPLIKVQHHHAHLASVMAENAVHDKCIGIILDGTGYGSDHTIWGGEVLIGDFASFERYAWLDPVMMPGGVKAIEQPWRMTASYLRHAFGGAWQNLNLPNHDRYRPHWPLLQKMMDDKINSPLTSSCGRLFDGVAALLGLTMEINFEAQAAIQLEMCVDPDCSDLYETALTDAEIAGAIPIAPLIRAIVAELSLEAGVISARFHRTLAELFVRAAISARNHSGIERVGLSGGVFQNLYFSEYLQRRLMKESFQVITHSQVPSNDGGLALGQVVIAGNLC